MTERIPVDDVQGYLVVLIPGAALVAIVGLLIAYLRSRGPKQD